MTNQITLPRDAEGREIPLDTKVLYDSNGDAREVQAFEFSVIDGMWRVQFLSNFIFFYTSDMHLTPPDSWEKLEEDLNRAIEARNESDSPVCSYTNHLDDLCDGCKFRGGGFNCKNKMLVDIASRIRKLRGDGND